LCPEKLDHLNGDFTTVVYIKNETDHPRKYSAHLKYPGGVYSLRESEIAAHQTVAVDFRSLRDSQTPGAFDATLPTHIADGQIGWSMIGTQNKSLSARSEQISLATGVASTYSCANCCPSSRIYDSVNPLFATTTPGQNMQYYTIGVITDCMPNSTPIQGGAAPWTSLSPPIATVDSNGLALGVSPGEATIQGDWMNFSWLDAGGQCWYNEYPGQGSGDMQVVGVQKIQYKGPNNADFADATGTLYVLKDTQITFKAIPNPTNATFPAGQPVWSGTSGATGTGVTVSVTFSTVSSSTSNFKTVVATSGNSSVTVNAVVYDLAKVVTPVDNFEGRAPTTFGLKEFVNLSTTITPSGVTSTQAGGLQWSNASGPGTTTSNENNDGTGTFTAPASPGNTTLKLNVLSGPSKDKNITQDVTTIAPSGTKLVLSTGRRHIQNVVGAGFKAIVYFDPKNVSFKNIAFSEGACDAVTTGYLSGVGEAHQAGPTNQILLCNSSTGCRGFNEDTVYLGHPDNPSPTPYGTGSWTWPIPWFYHSGGDPASLFTVNQVLTTDVSGNATISKAGASVTYGVNDATVSW